MGLNNKKSDSCIPCVLVMLVLTSLPFVVWLSKREELFHRYFGPLMVLASVGIATMVVLLAWSVARPSSSETAPLAFGENFKIPGPLAATVVWLLVFGAMINALDVMRPEKAETTESAKTAATDTATKDN
ncbi:hypothetical protein [Steroidobacter sp.]|uniref:hypothetical protein n=1 Tax=Steroidobacter sp. TaxID=1978227 RepID=UPI001A555ACF|nr:hypothetical protein [Steroidobacter sp.]MBL8266839.1 hypothetical protein [Steroidobacter sp.]